jgi:hypothetical protein
MFLRSIQRKKDGKDHRYFSIFSIVASPDVWIPIVDQRWFILPRHPQPSSDTKLLIEKLRLEFRRQPPPPLTASTESTEIELQTVR